MAILLIIIGICLIYINYRAIKKDKMSFKDVLDNKKDDISSVEVEVGNLRMDMADTFTELQKELLALKEEVENLKKEKNVENSSEEKNEIKFLLKEDDNNVINEIRERSKTELIKELIELGATDEEICNKLSLGKGEVLLVRGLCKK